MNRVLACCFFILVTLQANGQKRMEQISQGSDVTVIIFLAVECPISQKYIPRLNAIHEKYHDPRVKIYSLIPGKVKKKEIAKFRKEYAITFEVARDSRYELVKMLSAETTPEVFVFNRGLKLVYRGAIDNWFYALGGYRKDTTEDYLSDAIHALLNGKQPKIEKTKSLGCSIQVPGDK